MAIRKLKLPILFAVIIAVSFFVFASGGQAENRWLMYDSDTGIMSVRIPNEYEYKIVSLRNSPESLLHSEELIATIDQRPYKNAVKNFIISYDQTIGTVLGSEEVDFFVERELDYYEGRYRQLGALLKKRERFRFFGYEAGEVYLSFKDPELGLQGVRVRVMFSDMTKLLQIVIGPDHIMYAMKTKDFFESLILKNGVTKSIASFDSEWLKYTSPHRLFTQYLPPVVEPYVQHEPEVTHTEHAEVVSAVLNDPIRHHKLFYKVYGYKMSKNMTFANVQKLLIQRHVRRHGGSSSVKFTKALTKKVPTMEAEFSIKAPPDFPYIRVVKLRCFFIGKYIVVQEAMSSHQLTQSAFLENIMGLMEFHPQLALGQSSPRKPEEEAQKTIQ